MACDVIICSILNHILDLSYSDERIYFGFIEERYEFLALSKKSARFLSELLRQGD